jgi:hypothetical protein
VTRQSRWRHWIKGSAFVALEYESSLAASAEGFQFNKVGFIAIFCIWANTVL